MAGVEFKIKSDNPWDTLMMPTGKELKVGERIYNGSRTMLVNGVETQVAEQVYGGEYSLDNGKLISVADGVITEIKEMPNTVAQAKIRKEKYRK